MQMTKEIHVIVTGRVQMVMFRDFTKRKAQAQNIKGTVKNLKNGTVEIYAQGSDADIATFLSKLQKGSAFSRVDKVTVTEQVELKEYAGFSIIF